MAYFTEFVADGERRNLRDTEAVHTDEFDNLFDTAFSNSFSTAFSASIATVVDASVILQYEALGAVFSS